NRTSSTPLYALSLHDALPISQEVELDFKEEHSTLSTIYRNAFSELLDGKYDFFEIENIVPMLLAAWQKISNSHNDLFVSSAILRSEEHTSELQSRENLVCRLL